MIFLVSILLNLLIVQKYSLNHLLDQYLFMIKKFNYYLDKFKKMIEFSQ